MQAWKMAEKQVARILGGIRRIRVQYSESCEDVHHTDLAVEVKYGRQIPRFVRKIKEPTAYENAERTPLVLFPLRGTSLMSLSNNKIIKKKKGLGFLYDGLNQAYFYNTGKTPILCLKPNGFKGVIGCMYLEDYLERSATI